MNVLKRDGRLEPFQQQKIINSCILAELQKELAKQIAEEVSKKIYINMPTKKIRALVIKQLKKYDKTAAKRYESYERTKSFRAK